jgi:hypothetical protein
MGPQGVDLLSSERVHMSSGPLLPVTVPTPLTALERDFPEMLILEVPVDAKHRLDALAHASHGNVQYYPTLARPGCHIFLLLPVGALQLLASLRV